LGWSKLSKRPKKNIGPANEGNSFDNRRRQLHWRLLFGVALTIG
jgi:hypothetical protein